MLHHTCWLLIILIEVKTLDPLFKWESFKINVRDYSIYYAKKSKYYEKHKIKIIKDRMDYIANMPSSDINMNEKRDLEQELNSILRQ